MIVTVAQLREAAKSLHGCADADTVELNLAGGRTLVGVCHRQPVFVAGSEAPPPAPAVTTVSFSLPPYPARD